MSHGEINFATKPACTCERLRLRLSWTVHVVTIPILHFKYPNEYADFMKNEDTRERGDSRDRGDAGF